MRGTFDLPTISGVARANGGEFETHDGVTILSGSSKCGAVAFLNSSIAMAGQDYTIRLFVAIAGANSRGSTTALR